MNPISTSIVGLGIISIIEFVKRYFPGLSGGIIILFAALLGGYAGFMGIEGLNVITGIYTGLAAAGVHTVASAAGGN